MAPTFAPWIVELVPVHVGPEGPAHLAGVISTCLSFNRVAKKCMSRSGLKRNPEAFYIWMNDH